jgi:hypothetical protein
MASLVNPKTRPLFPAQNWKMGHKHKERGYRAALLRFLNAISRVARGKGQLCHVLEIYIGNNILAESIGKCKDCRYWSLWQLMEIFDTWQLSQILFRIECARKDAIRWEIEQGNRDSAITEKFKQDWIDSLLKDARELGKKAELESTNSRVNPNGGFSRALEDGLTYQELEYELRVLRESIQIDLSEKHVYIVSRNRHEYNSRDFFRETWGRVGIFFPSVRDDSFAAMRAYVHDLNTACVFHLMRVTEIGLRGLARRMRVTLPKKKALEWGQWQEIISAMSKKVDALAVSRHAGPRKDELLEFYRGAIGEFLGFKDAYRNFVMHMRDKSVYDPDEARSLVGRVSHFMNRLCQQIDEKGFVLTKSRIDRMISKIEAERAAEREKRKADEQSKSGIPEVRRNNAASDTSSAQQNQSETGSGESSKKAEA